MTTYTQPSAGADYTAAWLAIFERALHDLSPARFQLWLAGVGLMGTDADRTRKGEYIYDLLLQVQEESQGHGD